MNKDETATRERIPGDVVMHAPAEKRTTYGRHYVQTLFDSIAPRYDLLNRVLSLGIDQRWRRRALRFLNQARPRTLLDVATGTADVAIEAVRLLDTSVVGVDISPEMLAQGRMKVDRIGFSHRITLQQASAEELPFADASFDALTIAFGVRNFADLYRGLSEMVRVLKPGSLAVILEFSHPRGRVWGSLYRMYSRYILPPVGGLISRNRDAYEYLPRTVREFPDGSEFADILMTSGFSSVRWFEQNGGIATIYVAET
jgi:demethylmenaquinone methyltransferase/2-methoxy-6-polyprenyl-1,4-benzoquinol methylase